MPGVRHADKEVEIKAHRNTKRWLLGGQGLQPEASQGVGCTTTLTPFHHHPPHTHTPSLKEPGVLLKDPGVVQKEPGVLLKDQHAECPAC